MRFDLTDLRLFLNVHEAGTITGGAQATHMTLASASERIRGMEDALGVPLLTRDSRGVRVTPAGSTLVHHARMVLRQMDQLYGELGEYGSGLKGHVRLLCNTSALSEHLPEAISAFLAAHPGISVDLEERTSFDIVDALRHGTCELGIVSDSVPLAGLHTLFFRDDPLVLIVPRAHGFAARTAVRLAELVDLPFVGLGENSALQTHVAHHVRLLGRPLAYRIRVHSLESVCRVVGTGIGVGIVPKAVAIRQARVAGIRRVRLDEDWATRRLVLAMRDPDALPAHARQLIAHLRGDAHAR
ncbi:LysR family transcriptional regulator [Verticiella sediminum]|uniref:LysR family transcriptional regulator n=1 Tax=Verticiella sediminum TaxID=1247510 RepID=A0A556A5X3_9BURK|nr:LysR family transcriptional regulator [Verticiella sediminum]TSH88278.1 LysR family transcriptional regulator [Verticiella sediminum]